MRKIIEKYFAVGIILFCSSSLWGQVRFEGQVGGANFIGFSYNTAFEISLKHKENRMIIPGFGIGRLAPGWGEQTMIVNTGLHYQKNRWGFGYEVTHFTGNFFSGGKFLDSDFIDLLIYPNANYTFVNNWDSKWYTKLSFGLYFAFSYFNRPDGSLVLDFEGDVIPGIGITVGTRL